MLRRGPTSWGDGLPRSSTAVLRRLWDRFFEEILGPLVLWSGMEDWVYVECLYRERGAQSFL